MAKSKVQRVREAEAGHRARGEKQIRLWVPNEIEVIAQIRTIAAKFCDEARAKQLKREEF
jgi:hypothetical protein